MLRLVVIVPSMLLEYSLQNCNWINLNIFLTNSSSRETFLELQHKSTYGKDHEILHLRLTIFGISATELN